MSVVQRVGLTQFVVCYPSPNNLQKDSASKEDDPKEYKKGASDDGDSVNAMVQREGGGKTTSRSEELENKRADEKAAYKANAAETARELLEKRQVDIDRREEEERKERERRKKEEEER